MSISIPNKNDPFVKTLTEQIGVTNEPIEINVIADRDAKFLDCFPTVQRKIKESGGRMILGWQFWKSANLIEAEFHAIWESPEKKLIDITPKPIPSFNHTLFLIDERLVYDEKQKDNFRINITQNKLVDDFIKICEAIFKFDNKGERALQYELNLTPNEKENRKILFTIKDIYQFMINQNLSKNSLCLCRSGKKFKHCHGKDLDKTLSKLT